MSAAIAATVERRYSTHGGFIRACRRYRSRILAAITFTDGGFALVLHKLPDSNRKGRTIPTWADTGLPAWE